MTTDHKALLEKHLTEKNGRANQAAYEISLTFDQICDAALAAIEEAVRVEREECAKVCENISLQKEAIGTTGWTWNTSNECAKAIRSRGNGECNSQEDLIEIVRAVAKWDNRNSTVHIKEMAKEALTKRNIPIFDEGGEG